MYSIILLLRYSIIYIITHSFSQIHTAKGFPTGDWQFLINIEEDLHPKFAAPAVQEGRNPDDTFTRRNQRVGNRKTDLIQQS